MTVSPLDANIEKWYVMAAYKFELKAEASLREAGIEVYLPKETIYVKNHAGDLSPSSAPPSPP